MKYNNSDKEENPLEYVQSHDWNKERLETLKKLYPDLFANEGNLNIREIAKILNYAGVNEVERYEFRWFGKSNAKREAFTPTDATFIYDEERREELQVNGNSVKVKFGHKKIVTVELVLGT